MALDNQAAATLPPRPDVNTTGRCYLLEIPANVRSRIIDFSLITIDNIMGNHETRQLFDEDNGEFIQPALASTNRQLRIETLAIYYGKTFQINTIQDPLQFEAAKAWLEAIEPYLAIIKRIKFSVCDQHTIIATIEAAPGKAPSFSVEDIGTFNAYADVTSGCHAARVFQRARADMQAICDSVGVKGFGAQEYIRFIELSLDDQAGDDCVFDSEEDEDFDDEYGFDSYTNYGDEEVYGGEEDTNA